MELPLTSLIIAGLGATALALLAITVKLAGSYTALRSQKRSGEVRRELMTEQWLPLVDPYPWDPQNFRFIGSPIDGVQFEDDRVIFVEFKSGSSQLSAKQTRNTGAGAGRQGRLQGGQAKDRPRGFPGARGTIVSGRC